jgi:anti-anti-sigma factor
MSKVSRIDSAGLGLLMQLYSHALRNRGILKVLKPSQQVQQVMHVAKVDSVVEAYEDEGLALRSFSN